MSIFVSLFPINVANFLKCIKAMVRKTQGCCGVFFSYFWRNALVSKSHRDPGCNTITRCLRWTSSVSSCIFISKTDQIPIARRGTQVTFSSAHCAASWISSAHAAVASLFT